MKKSMIVLFVLSALIGTTINASYYDEDPIDYAESITHVAHPEDLHANPQNELETRYYITEDVLFDINFENYLRKLNIPKIKYTNLDHLTDEIIPFYNQSRNLNNFAAAFIEKFNRLTQPQAKIVAQCFLHAFNNNQAAANALAILEFSDTADTDLAIAKCIIDPILQPIFNTTATGEIRIAPYTFKTNSLFSYKLNTDNYTTVIPVMKRIVNAIIAKVQYPGFYSIIEDID